MEDSVKTIAQGVGGVVLSFWEFLPDALRLLVLIATLTHIVIRIKKDLK
jgi:hypothetical protein